MCLLLKTYKETVSLTASVTNDSSREETHEMRVLPGRSQTGALPFQEAPDWGSRISPVRCVPPLVADHVKQKKRNNRNQVVRRFASFSRYWCAQLGNIRIQPLFQIRGREGGENKKNRIESKHGQRDSRKKEIHYLNRETNGWNSFGFEKENLEK
ncbi:hypothetical protein CDAR_483641 [Caerostris darwini]|uniref:Uncharacterized protein n=1 Tax=Caerostris darwini TaxID=1538125 RepID=A0AAV4TSU4_9ARAC|nr:hypothetical protein CDAR_483641 [Caerostris darwini]